MTPRDASRRAAALYRPLLVLLLLGLAPGEALAISADDQTLLTFMVRELRYFDTARRFLAQLEKKAGDPRDRADVAWWKIQILQMEEKFDEANTELADFKKQHPNDPRAMGGDLAALTPAVNKVVETLDAAAADPDHAKAAARVAEAVKAFDETVDKPLAAMIAGLEHQLQEHRARERKEKEKKAPKGPRKADAQLNSLLLSRDRAEITRVKMYLFYARKLPSDSPDRKAILEKGYKLADDFVQNRFDFFVMQYDAQLQKGIYAYELGRHAASAEDLKILFDAEPPNRPFSPEIVEVFKEFRLQAILFGARSLNAVRKYDEAAKSIEKRFLKPSGDEFDLTKLPPTLEPFGILIQLEYGISLAGTGEGQKGLDVIQKVIQKYSGPGAGPNSDAYVTDARKALGRLASRGIVKLRGVDYYQAGIGLKSDRRLEDAIDTFQLALGSLNYRDLKEMNETAPLCLSEIGELHFMLERYVESALAYQQIARNFPSGKPELLEKVARNFLGAASRATGQLEGGLNHSGFAKVREEAEAFRKRFGDEGFDLEQSLMVDAAKLEEEGKYAEARAKYRSVPREKAGKKVPFYHRAQASAWATVYTEWDRADEKRKKELEPEVEKAIDALGKIVPQALKDRDMRGAAKGSLALGQILYQKGRFEEAVAALKVFRSELKDDEVFRCFGLGYLALAGARKGDLAGAESDYKLISGSPCKDEALAGYVALEICDAFQDAGNTKKAAEYMLIHVEHPSSKDDLEKLENAVVAARRLARGGLIKPANKVMNDLIKSGKAKGEELTRQIIIFNALVKAVEKKWPEAIEKLEGYLKRWPARGNHPDDPYVLRDLGEAYLGGSDPKSPVEHLGKADSMYNGALGLMKERSEFDKTLKPVFHEWVIRLCEIKVMQGDAGVSGAYRQAVEILDSYKDDPDLGAKLKAKYLELRKEAEGKLK